MMVIPRVAWPVQLNYLMQPQWQPVMSIARVMSKRRQRPLTEPSVPVFCFLLMRNVSAPLPVCSGMRLGID